MVSEPAPAGKNSTLDIGYKIARLMTEWMTILIDTLK
jgi:hypothetical protein